MRHPIRLTQSELSLAFEGLQTNKAVFDDSDTGLYLQEVMASLTKIINTDMSKTSIRFSLLPAGVQRFGLNTLDSASVIALVQSLPCPHGNRQEKHPPIGGTFLQLGSRHARIGIIEFEVFSDGPDSTVGLRHCNVVTRDTSDWAITNRYITYNWGPRAMTSHGVFPRVMTADPSSREHDHEAWQLITGPKEEMWEAAFYSLPAHLLQMR